MRRLLAAAVLVVVSLLIAGAGCYTVLRHPTGSSVMYEGSYYKSCADCHADAAFYHPYGHPYYRYGQSHYGWGSYYGRPWWYDDYWWWDPHHDDDYEGPEVETGTRHLWSPEGWAPQGWGFSRPDAGADTPSRPEQPRDDDKKPRRQEAEKRKENKSEDDDDDDRNLWDKPKRSF